MVPEKIAEYGVAIFAIGCCFYILSKIIDLGKTWVYKRKSPAPVPRCSEMLTSVIEGNTKAITENTKSNQELQTIIQVSMKVQDTKMDEVLAKIR